eukprot:357859-Chlamydomonas_euryale.AAC.8
MRPPHETRIKPKYSGRVQPTGTSPDACILGTKKISPRFNDQSCCSGVYRCWTIRLTGSNSPPWASFVVLATLAHPISFRSVALSYSLTQWGVLGHPSPGAPLQRNRTSSPLCFCLTVIRRCLRQQPITFRDKNMSPLGSTISPAAQGHIDAGPYALLVPTCIA